MDEELRRFGFLLASLDRNIYIRRRRTEKEKEPEIKKLMLKEPKESSDKLKQLSKDFQLSLGRFNH